MKKLLFFILLFIFYSVGYSEEVNSISQPLNKDHIGRNLEKIGYIESLANKSKKFKDYCWYDYVDLGDCFRSSSMMIVGYSKKKNILAYLQKVPAQEEDSSNIYRLKVHNLNNNVMMMDKKFKYKVDSKEYEDKRLLNIEYFYGKNKSEIGILLKDFDISITSFTFNYLPYDKKDPSFFLGFSTKENLVKFGFENPIKVKILKNLVIKKSNKLIFKQNYSDKEFCRECIYPFFLLEPLTVIELDGGNQKVLIVGLLAYDFHSPNTLFFQLIGI